MRNFSLSPRLAGLLAALLVASFSLFPARAQTGTPVPAGGSATITAQKRTTAQIPDTPEGQKIFKDAQSQDVRDTLQAAIDSNKAGH